MTCAHIVGRVGNQVSVLFIGETVPHDATVVWSEISPGSDCAILRISNFPNKSHPLELASTVPDIGAPWTAFGFPAAADRGTANLDGHVQDPDGRDLLGRPALCLFSENVRVGAHLNGFSGSPVVSDGRVIGMLTQIIPKNTAVGDVAEAEFGLIYARPCTDLQASVYEGLRSGAVRLVKDFSVLAATVSHRTSPIREALHQSALGMLERYQRRNVQGATFIARRRANQALQDAIPTHGYNWIQVIAPAGAGKTTWSLHRAVSLSEKQSVAWLRATEISLDEANSLTLAILRQCGNADLDVRDVLRELHLSGSLILFIDGLEEVTDYSKLRTALHTFRQGQLGKKTHLVLLCREESMPGLQPYLDEIAPQKFLHNDRALDSQKPASRYIDFSIHPLSQSQARELLESTGAVPNQAMELYFKVPSPYNGRPFFLLRALEVYQRGNFSPPSADLIGTLMESYIADVSQRLRKDGRSLSQSLIRQLILAIARRAIFDPSGRVARDELVGEFPQAAEVGESSLLGRCAQAGLLAQLDEQWLVFGHALLLEYYAAQALVVRAEQLEALLERLIQIPLPAFRHTLLKLAPMLLEPEPLLRILHAKTPFLSAEVAAATKRALSPVLKRQMTDAVEPLLHSPFPSDWSRALSLLSEFGGDYSTERIVTFFNSKSDEDRRKILPIAAMAFLKLEVKGAFPVLITLPEIRSNYYFPSTVQLIRERSEEFQTFLMQKAREIVREASAEPWRYLASLKILAVLQDHWIVEYLDDCLGKRTLSQDENHALLRIGNEKSVSVYIANFFLVKEKIRTIKPDEYNEPKARQEIQNFNMDLFPTYADLLDNDNSELKKWTSIALESSVEEHINFGVRWAVFFEDEALLPSLNTAAASRQDRLIVSDKVDDAVEKILKKIPPAGLLAAYEKFPSLRKAIVHRAHVCPGKQTEDFLIGCLSDPLYRFSAIQSLNFLKCYRSAFQISSYVGVNDIGYFAKMALADLNYFPIILDIIIQIENELSSMKDPRSLAMDISRIGEFGLPEILPVLEEIYKISRNKENRAAVISQMLWSRAGGASTRVVALLKSDPGCVPSIIQILGFPYVSYRRHLREIINPEDLQIDNEELWNFVLRAAKETNLNIETIRAVSTFSLPHAEQFLESVAANAYPYTGVSPPVDENLRLRELRPQKSLQEEAQSILARRGRAGHVASIVDKACRISPTDSYGLYWAREELSLLPSPLVADALRDIIQSQNTTSCGVAVHYFIENGYAQAKDASLLRKLEAHADGLIADLAHRARLELCPEVYQYATPVEQKEPLMKSPIVDLAAIVYKIIKPLSNGTIPYSDLCSRLTGRWANLSPDSEMLAEALGVIVNRCRAAGMPALSAVVIHKGKDKMPGNGYFAVAHPGIDDLLKRQIAWATELGVVQQTTYPPDLDGLVSTTSAPTEPPVPADARDKVFLSYSHDDVDFLEQLRRHLAPYVRAGLVSPWSDRDITPGSQWFDEIRTALKKTKVAVMLVTSSFLASDFVHNHELGPFLKEAETGGVRILWVPVRACAWKATPLKNYQAAISPDKPLAEMTAKRDGAWVKICEKIEEALNSA